MGVRSTEGLREVRDDADVEEVVAQVGVSDAIALAAEPDSVSAASFCRSDPVVDSKLTLTHTNNQKPLAT
jgi:hypothetical protein